MTLDKNKIPDFSDLTCTNLMIRLKMLLKNAPPDSVVEIIVRRDQKDTIEIPFSRTGFYVELRPVDPNRYYVKLKEKTGNFDTK
jgi:hypothetical protein